MHEIQGINQQLSTEKVSPDALINKRFSLNELLTEGWERDVIVGSVEEYLSDFSITDLDQVVGAENPSTEIAKLKMDALSLFQERGINNRNVQIVKDKNGESKLLITYSIGQDRVVVIGKPAIYEDPTERRFPDGLIIEAEKMGFVDTNGVVMALDKLVKVGEQVDENHSIRLELDPKRVRNCLENKDKKAMKPLSLLPTEHGQIGSLMHEIGHLFIYRHIYRDSKLAEIMDVFEKEQNGLVSKPLAERNFSAFLIYSIKTRDERSAWAVGLSILRSLGKLDSVNSGITGVESVWSIKQRMEDKLSSYDEYYNAKLFEQPDDKSIPLASRRARKAARTLHQHLENSGLSYEDISEEAQSDFPSYVESPVFHINAPERILDKLIASLAN